MACKCITPRAYEVRISRPWWARLIPFSRMYYCQHCQEKSLYISLRGHGPEHEYRARADERQARSSPRNSH